LVGLAVDPFPNGLKFVDYLSTFVFRFSALSRSLFAFLFLRVGYGQVNDKEWISGFYPDEILIYTVNDFVKKKKCCKISRLVEQINHLQGNSFNDLY
ncbi:MAG TPA: hypothetical protein PKD87_14775, partial [Burkholderiaceae bacterium]|nr:hypothetical protein [Burkholderiaceae bacterium]